MGPAAPRGLGRLLPLAVSTACLLALTTRLDWVAVVQSLPAARWPLVALAALLTLSHVALRAVRWRLLLGRGGPALGPLLWAYAVGVAAGFALPGSGEVARAILLARRGGLRTTYVLGSVAVEKLLDTAAVLALLVVGLWQLARPGWLGTLAAPAAGALLLGAAGLGAAIVYLPRVGPPAPPRGLPAPLARVWTTGGVALAGAGARFASGATAALRLPPAALVAVGALTLLVWANACLVTVLTLAAFDLPADWALAAVLYGALLLGLSVPAAPGGLGPFELITVAVLDGVGLPLAPSAAFALGFHAVTFAPPLVAGALALALAPRAGAPAAPGPPVER